ncbi:hypothetical protein OQA88_10670 [Cercophora sp. LCS_1]
MAGVRISINGSKMSPALLEAIEKQMLEQAIQESKSDVYPSHTNGDTPAESSTGKKAAENRKRKAPEEESEEECESHREIKKALSKALASALGGSSNDDNGDDDDVGSEFRRCLVQPENIRETFANIHVSPEVLEALDTLRLAINHPEQFKLGVLANQPSLGVLMYGPPGTGKTLLARAVAKQANAKVISISGADIRSKYVGVAEKRIKDLFAYARKNAPCIIFIDEADSIFRSRSGSESSTSMSHTNDITQFLAEMEGISSSQGDKTPIVIAATNRPFDMDEGVLRRLGRRVHVDVPDKVGRERILAIHLSGEKLDRDVSLSEIATNTQGFTGSDLRGLVWETAIQAVKEIDWLQHDRTAGDKGSKSTETRVLRREHFLRARQLISPAPKEDLVAKIADFHNKHGSTGRHRVGTRDRRAEPINKVNGNESLSHLNVSPSSSSSSATGKDRH